MLKICSKCGKSKDINEFNIKSASKDGHRPECKDCQKIDNAKNYKKNKNKIKEHKQSFFKNNKKYIKNTLTEFTCTQCNILQPITNFRKSIQSNTGFTKICKTCLYNNYKQYKLTRSEDKIWISQGKGIKNIYTYISTPQWADVEKIKKMYKYVKEYNKNNNEKISIDHIIPQRNKFVCGLNVENNLKIISVKENTLKNNTFVSYSIDKNGNKTEYDIFEFDVDFLLLLQTEYNNDTAKLQEIYRNKRMNKNKDIVSSNK